MILHLSPADRALSEYCLLALLWFTSRCKQALIHSMGYHAAPSAAISSWIRVKNPKRQQDVGPLFKKKKEIERFCLWERITIVSEPITLHGHEVCDTPGSWKIVFTSEYRKKRDFLYCTLMISDWSQGVATILQIHGSFQTLIFERQLHFQLSQTLTRITISCYLLLLCYSDKHEIKIIYTYIFFFYIR